MLVSRSGSRRGSILAAALVALLVVVATAGIMLRSFANGRRQIRKLRQFDQIQWIVTATIQRESQRIRAHPEYAGESWTMGKETNSMNREVLMSTKAESVDDSPNLRRLSVSAEMLSQSKTIEITVKKQLLVAIPDAGESP